MRVRLLYFASLAERAGCRGETRDVPVGTTVWMLWESLVGERPALGGGATPMFARNGDYAAPQSVLAEGDEVGFLPPVGGG